MALEASKGKRALSENKVKKAAAELKKLLENANERTPTDVVLKRKIKCAQGFWKTFEEEHAIVLGLQVHDENELQSSHEYYNAVYDVYEDALGDAEVFLEERANPVDDTPLDHVTPLRGCQPNAHRGVSQRPV